MTARGFRRIALGMDGAIESSHMNHPDFRVNNRIFATLAHDERSGVVLLPPDVQQESIRAHPAAFSMVNGAWGAQGATRVHLELVEEDALGEAMTIAWRTAVAKRPTKPRAPVTKTARLSKPPAKSAKSKAAPSARTLNALLAPYPQTVRSLARATRALMMEMLPKAGEAVDPTGPYVTYGYAPGYKGVVGYMTISQKGVKLGVAGGSSLPDPNKLLQGSGKSNRHVVIRTPEDLEAPGLRQLVREALARWKKDNT